MIEYQNNSIESEFSNELKSVLKNSSSDGVVRVQKIVNLEKIDLSNGELKITTTLCPLYARGSLEESVLITYPSLLSESRVYGKWQAGVSLVNSANRVAERFGLHTKVFFNLADLGVISRVQNDEILASLNYNKQLYIEAAKNDLPDIDYTFTQYSDIVFDFPRFIKPGGSMDRSFSSSRDMEEKVNGVLGRLKSRGIVLTENFNIKIINKMIVNVGVKITEGLLMQYGTFDPITTRDGALNTFFERSGLFLQISDLFPHGQRTRIDVLC